MGGYRLRLKHVTGFRITDHGLRVTRYGFNELAHMR